MWKRISVKNYRAMGERGLSLPLAPLTVFVGENGTGKSAFLETLALTAQSVHDPHNRRGLALSGELVDLPQSQGNSVEIEGHLYHRKQGERALSVELEWEEQEEARNSRRVPPARPGLWKDVAWPPPCLSYRWEQRLHPARCWHHAWKLGESDVLSLRREIIEMSRGGGVVFKDKGQLLGFSEEFDVYVPDSLLFLDRPFLRPFDLPNPWKETLRSHSVEPVEDRQMRDEFVGMAESIVWATEVLRDALKRVSTLLPLRGLQLVQKDTGPEVRKVGKYGEQAFRLLANLQTRRNPGFAKLRKWAERFGMKGLEAAWAGGQQLKVDYQDPFNGTILEAEDAATGSRQMLILLTHLLLSTEPMTCIVEEPECNLHPAYEKMLPEVFADSIAQGNQLLVTTHSEIIIAAIGQAVRAGRLGASDVKIWHLERNGAEIEAQEIPVSERGRIAGWVKSFAKVEEELLDEWFETSPEDRGEVDP